jgi:hypothetical protein
VTESKDKDYLCLEFKFHFLFKRKENFHKLVVSDKERHVSILTPFLVSLMFHSTWVDRSDLNK